MFTHGARTLSDAELLAVILGTGIEGKNAMHLARELLAEGLQSLRRTDLARLAHARGVGPVKTARIAATLELANRIAQPPHQDLPPYDPTTLGMELVKTYGLYAQERFGAALLDARHRVMKHQEIFIGTLDRALVSTREILRFAVVERGKGVVIYHNHPSGDPAPSDEDILFTRKLRESLEMADIDLVDHLVIGDHRFVSLRQRGDL
jgi:DNA repair protein RadC